MVTSAQGSSAQDVSKCWQTGTVTTVTSGTVNVTVNTGTTYQTWNGFGGAFNELGWKSSLRSAAQI